MNLIKKQSHWLILLIFLLLGGIYFFYLYHNSRERDLEARLLNLDYQHNRSVEQFKSSIDKFAGLVSGMKSYVNLSPQQPTTLNFQKFVGNQYSDLTLKDSIVVSFIDTSHVFQQSFTLSAIDPVNLVGRSVRNYRNAEKIERLDNLMTHDSLIMFPPINLVEGWVGLPIDFRVHRNDTTFGYVAPILSFRTILDDIYDDDMNDEFIFHFSTQDGFDFDREKLYDNSQVFNDATDSEYYKNFDIDSSQFLYTSKKYYGFGISIGTAYKTEYAGNRNFLILLVFSYITIALLATNVAWQVNRFRKLNTKLFKKHKLLVKKREEIEDKNLQLQKLNITQSKFFSIIGHDIKQPLNAIEGLLHLLHYEEITDPDLAEIIKNLKKSTKNTTNLLNNLLRWARSQTGDIKFTPSQVNLNTILENEVATLFFQAKEKSIRILHQPQTELYYYGDKDMLSTIFRNLISNAIKFTNMGGIISIASRMREKSVEISVVDSGVGMTPENVRTLFELNTQQSSIGTSGEMGTGLGLILCDLFTKKHGGHILVESEIDKGSTFTIVLPL